MMNSINDNIISLNEKDHIYSLEDSNIEHLYLNSNQFSGSISNEICNRKESINLLIYGNAFCPPYPNCIKYIGKQTCEY